MGLRRWYPLILILADLVFVAVVYPRLPQRMPVHWAADGTVNGYGTRFDGAFFLPILAVVVWLLMRALPAIDPRRANYASFAGVYDVAVGAVVTVVVIAHAAMLSAALGLPVHMDRLMPAVLGMLFIVLGIVLPSARPNWWFGVRTPWTLSNDRVWARTHRVAGRLLVAAGLVSVIASVAGGSRTIAVVAGSAGAAAVISVVFSYFAWKQESSR